MKINKLFLFSIAAAATLFASCDDNLSTIGSTVRPSGESLDVQSTTIDLESRTIKFDSIYCKTSVPLLGEIYDSKYGTLRSDYASEFYGKGFNLDVTLSDSTLFSLKDNPYGYKDSLVNNAFDSIVVQIQYASFLGDSLSPMQVTAYEIEEKLPKNFYTNIDFEPYIPNKKVLGKKFYTGVDYTLPDSLKNDNYSYVAIKMNDELKKRFYDALIKTPEVFETQSSFNDFFKGIYFKNTHGNGTMLKVGLTRMYFHYRTYHDLDTDGNPLKSSTGADSSYIVDRVKDMIISPEIIQLNSVKHSNVNEAEILNNDTATYVTSPAGYYTVIDVPVGKIMKELVANDADERFLNGVTLNIQAYKPENDDLFSTPPSNMLLVEKSKINEFFEGRKLPDSESYYAASYASDSTSGYWQYNFGNINRLVLSKVKELGYSSYESVPEDITIEMAVVPVSASLNDYGTAYTAISNYFAPSGVVLKSGTENAQKSTITFTLQEK